MSIVDRLTLWNRWYDTAPAEWRFQLVLWTLLAVGTINMMLTIATGFPFALLVLLGIIALTAIRIPYAFGLIIQPTQGDVGSRFRTDGLSWLTDLNRRYEALPESRRIWIYPAVLLIAGAVNMMLTIRYGFPFGLLFLIALLGLVMFRAPYTAGWLQSPAPAAEPPRSAEPDHVLPAAVEDSSPAVQLMDPRSSGHEPDQ